MGLITTLPQQAYTTLVHTYSRQKGIENNVMVCHGVIGVILKRREDKVDKLRETTSSELIDTDYICWTDRLSDPELGNSRMAQSLGSKPWLLLTFAPSAKKMAEGGFTNPFE